MEETSSKGKGGIYSLDVPSFLSKWSGDRVKLSFVNMTRLKSWFLKKITQNKWKYTKYKYNYKISASFYIQLNYNNPKNPTKSPCIIICNPPQAVIDFLIIKTNPS